MEEFFSNKASSSSLFETILKSSKLPFSSNVTNPVLLNDKSILNSYDKELTFHNLAEKAKEIEISAKDYEKHVDERRE